MVIATDITQGALNLLVTNKNPWGDGDSGSQSTGLGTEKSEVLQDLATLCGGEVILQATGVSGKSHAGSTRRGG